MSGSTTDQNLHDEGDLDVASPRADGPPATGGASPGGAYDTAGKDVGARSVEGPSRGAGGDEGGMP